MERVFRHLSEKQIDIGAQQATVGWMEIPITDRFKHFENEVTASNIPMIVIGSPLFKDLKVALEAAKAPPQVEIGVKVECMTSPEVKVQMFGKQPNQSKFELITTFNIRVMRLDEQQKMDRFHNISKECPVAYLDFQDTVNQKAVRLALKKIKNKDRKFTYIRTKCIELSTEIIKPTN